MFREKLANYVIRTLTHPDDVVKIVRKMEDPATGFEKEHIPKDLTDEEAESMAKKSIFEQKCKLYVARRTRADDEVKQIKNVFAYLGTVFTRSSFSHSR